MSEVPHITSDEMVKLLEAGSVVKVQRDLIEINEDGWIRRYVHPTSPQRGIDADGNVVATIPPPGGYEQVVEKIISLGLRARLFQLAPSDLYLP